MRLVMILILYNLICKGGMLTSQVAMKSIYGEATLEITNESK